MRLRLFDDQHIARLYKMAQIEHYWSQLRNHRRGGTELSASRQRTGQHRPRPVLMQVEAEFRDRGATW